MKRISIAAWGLLLFLYGLKIFHSYLTFDFDSSFGYFDHQLYWQTLLDFIEGKALYKNIFWEYNLLPIFIRLPFFLLLQKSFFASIFINLVIIPIIGIILSFYIGKQLLGKKALYLFGLLLLFMGTNTNYSNIRYLIPELGLLMTIIGMEKNDKKKTLIGSIIMGISLLTTIEYAIASQIGLLVYFLSVLIIRKKIEKKQWLLLLLIETFVGTAFLIYLLSNNALPNFIQFHREYINTFYSESPCREVFPRIALLDNLKSKPIQTLFRLNYYFAPFFLLITGTWLLLKKNIRFRLILMVLLIYSLFVAYRIVSTPCYYSYGMTFPLLILSYLIFQAHISRMARVIFIGIAIWFILTSNYFNPFALLFEQPWKKIHQEEKEFLPGANMYLNKKYTQEYKDITKYIQSNTRPDEYVYSHRVGPYNQLANRRSPVSAATSAVYEAAPFLVDITVSELKKHPPKFIVVNILNGDSTYNIIKNIRSNVHLAGDMIIFQGDMTPVEDYISQNYMIDKMYNIAWVLKRRKIPIRLTQYYVPLPTPVHWTIDTKRLEKNISSTDSIFSYDVIGKEPIILFFAPEIKKADHIEVPIKVDLGAIKPFSKFVISFFLITNTNQTIHLYDNILSSNWSTQWIYIPRSEELPKGLEIKGVIILVSDNLGFLPWGRPPTIQLDTPKLYIKNPHIGITMSGYKKKY